MRAGARTGRTSLRRHLAAGLVCACTLAGCGAGERREAPAPPPAARTPSASERLQQLADVERLEREVETERRRLRPETDSTPRPSGETATDSALLSEADRASFERLAARLGGASGIAVSAVGTGGPVSRAGSLQTGVAWSTSKVPVAMAVIAAGLEDQQASDLERTITASDNEAALALWRTLGSADVAASAATQELRGAGDARTVIEPRLLRPGFTPFGQTDWRLTDQARFVAGMPCTPQGVEVLGLMGQTVPDQRWGLGRLGGDVQLKGGWGPGSAPGEPGGYLTRQMGLVDIGGVPVAAAIATAPADASHATGIAHLDEIARWLADHVTSSSAPPAC